MAAKPLRGGAPGRGHRSGIGLRPVPASSEADEQPRPARIGERADFEAVAQEVLRTAVDLLEADSGSLYYWEAESGLLRCLASWNVRGARESAEPAIGRGIVGRAFYHGRSLVVNDYQDWEGALAEARERGLRAAIAVPLSRAGKLLGVLLIRSFQPEAWFTDDNARLVALLADPAAAALLTAEAFERQRRAASRSRMLVRIARRFAAESDPERLLADLLAEAVTLLGGDSGAVSRWDSSRQCLVAVRHHGRKPGRPTNLVRPGQGAAGRAVERWAAVIENDHQHERTHGRGRSGGPQAAVAVPLHHDGCLLGAIEIDARTSGRRFTADDAEMLELLAGIVSATIARLERVQLESVLLTARTVQHELNNCLARSSGYAEILLREADLPAHLREMALQVRDSVRAAAEVLSQFQWITHLEKKVWGPQTEPTIDIDRSVR